MQITSPNELFIYTSILPTVNIMNAYLLRFPNSSNLTRSFIKSLSEICKYKDINGNVKLMRATSGHCIEVYLNQQLKIFNVKKTKIQHYGLWMDNITLWT